MRAGRPVDGWVRDRLTIAADAVVTCGLAAVAYWAGAPWLWVISAGWAVVTLLQTRVATKARRIARHHTL